MRPIDADVLLAEYDRVHVGPPGGARKLIEDAPTIEPKRERGRWIETDEGTYCGVCFQYPYDDNEYHIAGWRSAFCPNCGADMRGNK